MKATETGKERNKAVRWAEITSLVVNEKSLLVASYAGSCNAINNLHGKC